MSQTTAVRTNKAQYRLDAALRAAAMEAFRGNLACPHHREDELRTLYLDTPDGELGSRFGYELSISCFGMPRMAGPVAITLREQIKGAERIHRTCLSFAAAEEYLSGARAYEDACLDHPLLQGAGRSLDTTALRAASAIDTCRRRARLLQPALLVTCQHAVLVPLRPTADADAAAVRVTFERELSVRDLRGDRAAALSPLAGLADRRFPQALAGSDDSLMSVEYGAHEPAWFARALSDLGVQPTSFSAYRAARRAVGAERREETDDDLVGPEVGPAHAAPSGRLRFAGFSFLLRTARHAG